LIENRSLGEREVLDPRDVERTRAMVDERLFGATAKPERMGRFVLLEQIGAGAMGRVFAAYDPELDRRIALKVIRTVDPQAMGQRRARLLREAKAMARLSHPNVLPVYDAGAVDDEVFIAMEYVDGGTLRQWLRKESRSWRDILRIFVDAGRGLAAAHQAEIVHRDFKPDNVLLGEDGRVRVVDFGLARAAASMDDPFPTETEPSRLDPDALADSKLTRTGAVLGTPAYMSPEQFEGDEADARSDQFSFCVSLWEALYGRRPFRGKDVFELVDKINARAYQEASRDARAPVWVRRALERGLSASPARRYPSMVELLEELARDPDQRRRKVLAIAGGASLLAAGAVGYATLGGAATDTCTGGEDQLAQVWGDPQRAAAQGAFVGVERGFAAPAWELVASGLDAYATQWGAMHRDACEATRVRGVQSQQLMDRRMLCLDRRLAALRATVDTLSTADVEVVERGPQVVRALPEISACANAELLASDVEAPANDETRIAVAAIDERLDRARALLHSGKYEPGLHEASTAATRAETLDYPPIAARALAARGQLESRLGQSVRAERSLLDGAALAEAHHQDELVAELWLELAAVGTTQRKRVESARLFTERAAAAVARIGDPDEAKVTLERRRAALALLEIDYESAAEHQLRALELASNAEHESPALVPLLLELGNVRQRQARYEDAATHYERALRIATETLGKDHPQVAMILGARTRLQIKRGAYDPALEDGRASLRLLEAAFGSEHPRVAKATAAIGRVYYSRGDYERAAVHYRDALTKLEASVGTMHPDLPDLLDDLGLAETWRGNWDVARQYFDRALEIQLSTLGEDHPQTASIYEAMGILAANRQRPEEALEYAAKALRIRERTLGPEHTHVGFGCNNFGDSLRKSGRIEESVDYFRRARDIMSAKLGPEHVSVAFPLSNLGRAYWQLGRPQEALVELERALEIRTKGETHPDATATTQFDIARALTAAKRDPQRARQLAKAAYDHFSTRGEVHEEILGKIEKWFAQNGGMPS
jgi:tetratricopeptide (TPR) repeat protein/predicted Ser/Thr protein kinase